MKIAFRVDASLRIGTGHLIRCLTLANILKEWGAETLFVCRHLTEFFRSQVEKQGHAVVVLPHREDAPDGNLAHRSWLGVSQPVDAADTQAALQGQAIDWLVVDHYGLDAQWETLLRSAATHLLALDDLADRHHDVDLLLDQNLQNGREDRYAGLLPATCRRLIGPRFALLRPEFKARAATRSKTEDRVNIFFGGIDPDGITSVALKAFDDPKLRDIAMDVVVGVENPHRAQIIAQLASLPNAQLHLQPANMGELMGRARLALGAGGATSWERCCLGVPTLLVSIADNQKSGCRALARARSAFYLGDIRALSPNDIAEATKKALRHPRLLTAMGRRAAALVDGRGTDRVALSIVRDNICLRLATKNDAESKWQWRNDPQTRRHCQDPKPLGLTHHLRWWDRTLAAENRVLLIAHYGDTDVGVLRYDLEGDVAIVSIYLDPELTGLGLGTVTLAAGTNWLKQHRPSIREAIAEVLEGNTASAAMFAQANYERRSMQTWKLSLS